MRACVRACACACVHLSLASDSSETIEVIIKLGVAIASDMLTQHVLIILTLTFRGYTYLNRENNRCSIILETVQAIPIKLTVKILHLKVYIIFPQSDNLPNSSLEFTTASQT